MSFKEFLQEEYNYSVHGKGNSYVGMDMNKLKDKKKSFQSQIADLRDKVLKANLGSGGNKKAYFEEIKELETKLKAVDYAMKASK
jgi:hypothetical protein